MMCFVLLLFYIIGAFGDHVPTAETSLGKITGYHRISYEGRVFSAFEGIPYAQPPTGDLRFEAPKPVKAWNDVLNANRTYYVCKQIQSLISSTEGNDSEDCLYLNVYVPKDQPSRYDNFDVIVYIHGGGFMIGDAFSGGPSYIMDREIIYVNLNYRVGILGFLSTEDTVVPGNNGLKDQQLALKWVQEHIKNFGGNPKSVTLMGLSAGGSSVHYHYFSPQSKGLFQRGISQSGTALMPWAFQEAALEKTKKLATLLNCQNSNIQTLVDCLKKIPVDELVAKTNDFYVFNQMPIAQFAPVVEVMSDTAFITKHPYRQLADGEINDVPWLTWIAKDEGLFAAMYVKGGYDVFNSQWDQMSEYLFDYEHVTPASTKKGIAHKIKNFYFQNNDISEHNLHSLVKAFGDRNFNVGFETAVRMQTKVAKSPVYAGMYGFKQGSLSYGTLLELGVEGVSHADDAFLLHDVKMFPVYGEKLSEAKQYMKDLLLDFIASFAKDGKPIANGIDWERMTTKNFNYLFIQDVDDIKMVENNNLAPIEFWEGLNFFENSKASRRHDEL